MSFKLAFAKLVKIFLTLITGAIVVVYMLVKTLFKGPSIWHTKRRVMPEDLMNPEYGIHRHIQLKDIKLHYVECRKRDKPLMLFLHGFPEFWYSWRHQIKAFKNDYWTVAVDMRGFGESDKPNGVKSYDLNFLVEDVKNLITALGHQSCVLVSHDWGGLVGLMFANRYPEMAEKFILCNSCHPAAFEAYLCSTPKQLLKSWYMFFFQVPFIPEMLYCMEDFVLFDHFFKKINPKNRSVTDEEIEAFKYCFSTRDKWTGPINYYRSFNIYDKEILDMKLRKIEVPSLIMWGCNDLYLERELAQRSADYFLNCKIKYVEDAGHFVQQDAPSIVNEHMASFLNETFAS